MGPSGNVEPLVRTLEQELAALMRGLSLECLVCGEFVMHAQAGVVFCPECGSQLGEESALRGDTRLAFDRVEFETQAG
jgi:Zn finger protein HypA/HybF involved in hydrogenase expression